MSLIYKNSKGDSVEFGNSAPYMLGEIEGLSSHKVKVLTQKGYGQEGESFHGVNSNMRIISHDITIVADNKAELQELRRELIRVCNPRLGLGELVYKDEYYINAVVSIMPDFTSIKGCSYACVGGIAYTAPNPDWLSVLPTTLKLIDFFGGLSYPKQYPISFAQRGNGATIDYTGDVEANVKIDIRGPAENPQIGNSATEEKIETQNLSLATGEKLIIESNQEAPSVVLVDASGAETNGWNKIKFGSKFWRLQPGSNKISFSAASGSPECYLTYREHYIGI